MYWQEQVPHYLLFCCVANVLQISDKQAQNKGIRTKNPINAKSVQLIDLHAFAYCLLCVYLSALLDLLISKLKLQIIVIGFQFFRFGLPVFCDNR